MFYKYIAVLAVVATVHGMVLPSPNCQPVMPYNTYAPCYSGAMNYAPGFQTQGLIPPVQPRVLPLPFNNKPLTTAVGTKPAVFTQPFPQVNAQTVMPSAQYSMPSLPKSYTLPTSFYGTPSVGQTFPVDSLKFSSSLPNYMTGVSSMTAPVATSSFGAYSTPSLMPTYGSSFTPGLKTGFAGSFPSYIGGSSLWPQMGQFSTQPATQYSFGTPTTFGTSSFGTPTFGTSSFGTPTFGTPTTFGTQTAFGTPTTFGTLGTGTTFGTGTALGTNPFSSMGYTPYSTTGLNYSPTYPYSGLNGLPGTKNNFSFK